MSEHDAINVLAELKAAIDDLARPWDKYIVINILDKHLGKQK
jgi:hypothetical protein